jgi:hypothetical protein
MADTTTSEEQLRQVALARIKRRRDFSWHLITYVVVNALMVVVWAIGPRESFWPMWLMIFWGIGLVFHGWYALSRQEATEPEVQAEIRRMRGSGPGAGE